MSLKGKRILAGIYVTVLIPAAGNHHLRWNLTGDLDKKILAGVIFIGAVCAGRFGPRLLSEINEFRAKQTLRRNSRND